MANGLDVILVDSDPCVCDILSSDIKHYYAWGGIITFTDPKEVIEYCEGKEIGIAVFVIEVFLEGMICFELMETLSDKFPAIYEDAIIITAWASDDIVNTCLSHEITHFLEKPIELYSLQLSIRSVVEKYLRFAKKIMKNPEFADSITSL